MTTKPFALIECDNCHGEGMLWTMQYDGTEYGDRCANCAGRGMLFNNGQHLPPSEDNR